MKKVMKRSKNVPDAGVTAGIIGRWGKAGINAVAAMVLLIKYRYRTFFYL
jgi:hypothetical protein